MDTCGFAVADAISDIFISIGTRVSYNVGACNMIPAVPTMTAIVNNHKNKRSNTIATYFQSSFTCPVYSGVFQDDIYQFQDVPSMDATID